MKYSSTSTLSRNKQFLLLGPIVQNATTPSPGLRNNLRFYFCFAWLFVHKLQNIKPVFSPRFLKDLAYRFFDNRCRWTSYNFWAFLINFVQSVHVGRLFAVAACIETSTSLVASLIFNNIYKSTVSTFPGLSFLVMAGILVIPLTLMV